MDRKKIIRQFEDFIGHPGEQLGRGARFLRFQFDLWTYCAKRLHQNNLLAMSAALSFRTIFAIIPILVFGFLVLKSVGVVEDGKRTMRELLNSSGFAQIVVPAAPIDGDGPQPESQSAPERGDEKIVNVADQIEQLVADVENKLTFQRLGPVGAIVLIWTALTLFTTIEQSLNRVFEAPRSRAIARRVLLFWSVLTLGPVLVVVVTYFCNLGVAASEGITAIAWLTKPVGWLFPIFVGMIVIAMAYKLIPNTHVKFAAAFGGAAITVPLWLVSRSAFSVYVERFVLKGNLYGVLGVLPLFMIWLNLSWAVFLFGAQLAQSATNLRQFRQARMSDRRPIVPSDWLAVMLVIARSFEQGRGPAQFDQIAEQAELSPESLRPLLDRLMQAGLICTTENEREPGYLATRPPGDIQVSEVLRCAESRREADATANHSVRPTVTKIQDKAYAAVDNETLGDYI